MTGNGQNNLLTLTYEMLDYNAGTLLDVESRTEMDDMSIYLNKGQWLELCRHINATNHFKAEKIFFVENSPVIVFVDAQETDHDHLHEIFNHIWCMARPRILFLSTPGELNVYDLAQMPTRDAKELKPLQKVKQVSELATRLKNYRREQIECGEIFNIEPFKPISQRADKMLIEDLKELRSRLIQKGLHGDKLVYAHALIGRSIFIRYLEDRNILKKEYFEAIAAGNPKWRKLLETPSDTAGMFPGMTDRLYPRVLKDKDFTFALFSQLTIDFNGNMFPSDSSERDVVTVEHLTLISDFLTGTVQGQRSLFFWAYRFDIIPIELISNIYEEFYHFTTGKKSEENDKSTHYTSIPLVEFVLARTLTEEVLKTNPRVIDPACGSGIFLVEAFRRIVRYECKRLNKSHLSFHELEIILNERIAGIEINNDAVKITAFSLYIAFLHFLEPIDILDQIHQQNKLPNLIYSENREEGKKYFDNLLPYDAFAVEFSNLPETVKERFSADCADVVIGNPPWEALSSRKDRHKPLIITMKNWYKGKKLPGKTRNDTVQAFLWRSQQLLKPGGICGILVGIMVLFKNSEEHRIFKAQFLSTVTITEVANFTLSRTAFFNKAIAPFAALFFKNEQPHPSSPISYCTVRNTDHVNKTQEILLNKNDYKSFTHADTSMPDIWKTYLFGNLRDHGLISYLRQYPQLNEYMDLNCSSEGYKEGTPSKRKDVPWPDHFKTLTKDQNLFPEYGPIPYDQLPQAPRKTEASRELKIYQDVKLVVKKAIIKSKSIPGHTRSRLVTQDLVFPNLYFGIKLKEPHINNYKIVLAILRSTLARYYFFITASRWGAWRDEILSSEIKSIPIAFPNNEQLKKRLLHIIDNLLQYQPCYMDQCKEINQLKAQLDEAVFDLYDLTPADRALIRERCRLDIDHYYNGSASIACSPLQIPTVQYGTLETLQKGIDNESSSHGEGSLLPYLEVFIKQWTHFLEDETEFHWQVVAPTGVQMLAAIFTQKDKGKPLDKEIEGNNHKENVTAWRKVLTQFTDSTHVPIGKRVYVDGMVKIVDSEQIIIVKRNEVKLWTISAAMDDAGATLAQAIKNNRHSRAQ